MANRAELLNAMRVIKEHCKESVCEFCEIEKECDEYLDLYAPAGWEIESGEADE